MTSQEKAELQRMVRLEVARAMNIILNGQARDSKKDTEGIANMFPGMTPIEARPKVLPWGLASTAPDGTLNVSARVGDHAGARYVIGHRDANRPDHEVGETVLYNQFGQLIHLKDGNVMIGASDASHPYVLGDIEQGLWSAVLQLLATHTHICSPPGVLSAPPTEAPQFDAKKTSPVDDGTMLSETIMGVE